MHCVVNKNGVVVAIFLLESDAQDFIHNCRTPYNRKDYTVEYMNMLRCSVYTPNGNISIVIKQEND